MDHTTFSKLLKMITPMIEKQNTCMREPISSAQRLSWTLRYLATGVNFKELKFITAIAPQTIGKIIIETCKAITTALKDNIKIPASEKEWKIISDEFESKWNFNHCLGAIDGKHNLEIIKPQQSGSYFFNYKHTFSIVLMAIANANYEFIMVDIGANGRVSDGGVFSNTLFYKYFQEKKLKIPESDYLPGISDKLPYVFVADDVFPLSNNLMKPYPHRNLSKKKNVYSIIDCRELEE
ncbi:uncharacterized protein LOC126895383 [Daktulosphaira vitifoliae]|uniref:uncharacterized protein LOC126895383 n=1 Tax=Daktulosphaira vitifoliae TaxID=58002 RepID=UPI0021AABC83|nr:uncharacterized protein LOC126895383 [Daktulosphaira vitifoliae]